jgi:aspartate-semialdehyde dehydrogenase
VTASTSGPKTIIIDCTGHLDRQEQARIVAPLLEHPGPAKPGELVVLAHPAASALALVLTRLARHAQLRRAVVQIFEPASERGKRGIAELHQQTTGLLSFKPLEKDVFDNQLSFNLLAQYGAEAPEKLSAVERRIEEHLSFLLRGQSSAEAVPMPSLRLIQAPVFHGYSISAWVEFAREVNATELGEALASTQIEVRGAEEEAPHGVGATSQSGLIAGDIRVDRNDARAAWFWVVGDNLRLTADGVADILGEIGTDQL